MFGVLALGLVAGLPMSANAKVIKVNPGDSIQAAVDAASPGDTIRVNPGDYTEPHTNAAAVRITKRLKLIANNRAGKVRLLPGPSQRHGILIEPANPGDPNVERVKVKGFTIEGFPKMGIWLRYANKFKIEQNESIENLENGIFPTLSANGLVKKNVSYGAEDAALWVEASENVRVIGNQLSLSPTGLEITVSKNIYIKQNEVFNNTVGVGLYHPNGASLPPLGNDGDWVLVDNYIHDNNQPNTAPSGSLARELPEGGGVLVLGVDRVTMRNNRVTNNNFFGIAAIDYCLAVGGSGFDCSINPPVVEPAPNDNTFIGNTVTGNGSSPPAGPFAALASDILLLGGTGNCYSGNIYGTSVPGSLPVCQ